jgi:hypothetical protein
MSVITPSSTTKDCLWVADIDPPEHFKPVGRNIYMALWYVYTTNVLWYYLWSTQSWNTYTDRKYYKSLIWKAFDMRIEDIKRIVVPYEYSELHSGHSTPRTFPASAVYRVV